MSKKSLRKFGSGKDIGMSLLWYWISYVVVTWIGIGHTIFNILVLHMGSMVQGPGLGEGYEMTKPWHPPLQHNPLHDLRPALPPQG